MFKSTIGCSNFREIREKQLTYVDKTYFIEYFLAQGYAEVSLISGPKGFGKTLTLKMLAEFFDITKKSSDIFQGLKIADNEEICQQWMNQYPVIYFTFKDLTAKDHQSSLDIFADQIYELYKKHEYLSNSDEITSSFKSNLEKIFSNESSESDLIMSLYNLCKYLKNHWGKSPILLLDEYDVLFKIYSHQKENSDLLNFIQGLLGRVLKDNQYLKFAVITGSFGFEEKYIFSQANNISYSSIESGYYKDIFGFTESEVDDLLELAESTTKKSQITSWYGGYQFGKTTDIYCPWDVITYLDELMNKPDIYPKPYRVKNNEGIVKKFLDTNDLMINRAMETLLVQRSIKTNLMGHFTHNSFNNKLSYFLNTLYSIGYLTESKESGEYITSPLSSPEISLCVPNLGIKEYLRVECVKWFKEKLINFDYENLLTAFWQGSNQKFADILHNILDTSMNFYNYEEAFYPVFLIELFAYAGCKVELYVEKETGKPHILVKDLESDPPRAAFIEVKYEPEEELDLKKTAKKALVYIALHKLQEAINLEEFEIIRWGVAFYEKRCAAKSQIVSRDYF